MLERGEIEIAPGLYAWTHSQSCLCRSFDEAQNTTSTQMKMFLSRMVKIHAWLSPETQAKPI